MQKKLNTSAMRPIIKTYVVSILIILTSINRLKSQNTANAMDTLSNSYFITKDRTEYMQKLRSLIPSINSEDATVVILQKMEVYLMAWRCDTVSYTDEFNAKESNLQALKSVKEGGYGIGAVLVDSEGKIIARGHNNQLQKHRSDLHGEMALLTAFEESSAFKNYSSSYVYKPGLTVFSSAEPCPMCFIRLATAGVSTKFCTPGPDDGMVSRINCLPESWRAMASKHSFTKGKCSSTIQKMAHLLFFSFLLDNRGPK